MTEGRYQYEPQLATPFTGRRELEFPTDWTNAEEDDYRAYLARESTSETISRSRWRRTQEILQQVRESILETARPHMEREIPAIDTAELTLQPAEPLEYINLSVSLNPPEREATADTNGDTPAQTSNMETLQRILDEGIMEIQAERRMADARRSLREEQLDSVADEMHEIAGRLERMLQETPEATDEIEAARHQLGNLESLYSDISRELEEDDESVINPPEETTEEVTATVAPEGITVRGTNLAREFIGNLRADTTVETVQFPTRRITAQPVDVDWAGYVPTYQSINSNGISSYTSPWKAAKRYRFDTEKINNTVAIVRVLQLILKNYSVSEADVEKFNLKDLVIED